MKITCPLCEFSHFIGTPGRLELPDTAILPEMKISNTKMGGGKIDYYEVDFEDFPGYKRTNLDNIEYRILKNYLERSEQVTRLLEMRLAEL